MKTKTVTFNRAVQLVEGGQEYRRGATHTDVPAEHLEGWYAEALIDDRAIVVGDTPEAKTMDGAAVANGTTGKRTTTTGR